MPRFAAPCHAPVLRRQDHVFTLSSCFGDISTPAAACLHKLHIFIESHALAGEREWILHVAPTGCNRWQPVPVIERLKLKAKVQYPDMHCCAL